MTKTYPKYSGNSSLVSICKTIRTIRSAQGFSHEEFKLATVLDRSYIGGIERGERKINELNLFKIARRLDIKVSELFSNLD